MELLILVVILFYLATILKDLNLSSSGFGNIIGIIYILSWLGFYIDLEFYHTHQYYTPTTTRRNSINCYSPFSNEHSLSLIIYLIAFNLSMLVVWIYARFIPPLILTFSLIFIFIGIILNVIILGQVTTHDIGILNVYNEHDGTALLMCAPFLSIIIGLSFIYKIIKVEVDKAFKRSYQNRFLNYLNNFLAKGSRNRLWLLILCIPVFFVVTLILILFGQETSSIIKVFTETATWRYSQHSFPPPVLDSGGHYLCTVAVAGDPKLVKPLRLGKRHGKIIVVNRQLLIANAFEELVQNFSPKLHHIIRRFYDRYGFNISKKINTFFWSNTVYVLMKPLEWFFLIILYLFCTKPEEKINAQYAV